MISIALLFRKLSPDAVLPAYKTQGAAGMDVTAVGGPWVINPGEWRMIDTGLAVQIPEGFELQVRSRSGLASTYGITVLNSPGTIDSDYRGEIRVLLHNASSTQYTVSTGERIAQLVFQKVERARAYEVAELDTTERGKGGFGSTGR